VASKATTEPGEPCVMISGSALSCRDLAAATGRSKGPVYEALSQLQEAGVLVPLSTSRRNQSWEADGLLDLMEEFEAGTPVRAQNL